jgi:hypothetical protein
MPGQVGRLGIFEMAHTALRVVRQLRSGPS